MVQATRDTPRAAVEAIGVSSQGGALQLLDVLASRWARSSVGSTPAGGRSTSN